MTGDGIIGTVLQGRYRVDRLLGEGGMGAVFAGENVKIGRAVAIKVLHPAFAQNPQIVARFHQEARSATSIGHPNIIEVLDMGELPDGSAYMVLEFLDGRDWSQEFEGTGPQSVGKVVQILLQVCDALAAAHDKGIVHRDLKPENIYLIARHGNPDFVKVLDFGISKVQQEDPEARALTGTNMMLGTAHYMSPEQAKSAKHLDHRSDIYTLGVILFYTLTGYFPFDDETLPMLILKICTEEAPRLGSYRKDLPSGLEQVYSRMIAKDPDERFADCRALHAALLPFLDHHKVPRLNADAPQPRQVVASVQRLADSRSNRPAGSGSNRILWGAVGAAALMTLIGGVVLLNSSGETAVAVDPVLEPAPNPSAELAPTTPSGGSANEEEIVISVFSSPAVVAATLWIDNVQQPSNPLTLHLPLTGELHLFEARAEGYETATQRVAYVRNEQVELMLVAETHLHQGRSMRPRVEEPRNIGVEMDVLPRPSEPVSTMQGVSSASQPMTERAEPVVEEPSPMAAERASGMVSDMFMGLK